MFGRRNLDKVGVRTFADVLHAEQSHIAVTIGQPNLIGNTQVRWSLRLRITPETEPPFEATVTTLMPQLTQPRPGTRLAVVYDPNDHRRVEVDSQPAAPSDQAIDTITAARPDLAAAQVMGMPMADLIRRAIADPNALRQEMIERSTEMQQQAMAAAQAAQAQAAAPPAQTADAQTSDPIDRLERLAALKDRGVITDDEFEEQKRKIVGH